MIAPPIQITQKTNLIFNNKKEFKINSNNSNYILSFSYNEELILFAVDIENDFPKKDYQLYINLEELTKIDKYLI